MFTARKVGLFIMALLLCVGCGSMIASGNDDHHVTVKIDRRAAIVRPTKGFGRAMLGMVRHPDGTIFVNTQTLGLYTSSDNGRTWKPSPVNFDSSVPTGQKLHGLGLGSDGKLWLLHQRHGAELFISNSMDGGRKWTTAAVDYANLAPGAPQKPFKSSDNDYNSFVELPDGTMMAAIELRYDHGGNYWDNYQMADQSIPGFHETVIRSTDGGKTWGDPTLMHQYVAETSMAIDPNDPSHILAKTRIQRMLLPGENRAAVESLTGCRAGTAWPYKNGILLESKDGGRSFQETAGGLIGHYEFRGTALWTTNDTVVIAHQGASGGTKTGEVFARISLDGGKAWVNGTKTGTPLFNKSKKFELVPKPPGHSYTTPTVEISPNHFLTAYAHGDAKIKQFTISGVFWHLEPASGK